jgi:MoaA/NifB/PqqE/SkfB family radical SAM enzyme
MKYTPYKIFHYQTKLDSLPNNIEEIKPPLHVRIKPTNVCAHDCWYCAYRVDNLQLGEDMQIRDKIPEQKMIEIVDDLAAMKVEAVTFSGGGDPFYYKPLLKTVKKLADNKINFASLTNGARLKGELAEFFAHYGSWLRVSIDGWDDRSYAEYRGIKDGEYGKLLDNLTKFKKLNGKCFLGISIVIDEKNAEHIYESAMRLYDTGVDSIKVSPCIVNNDGNKNNEYHNKIFSKVKKEINKLQLQIDKTNKELELFDAYHESEEEFDNDYSWCPYIQILPVIGADLNVYSCQDKAYSLNGGLLGDIKNQSFRQFWYSDKNNFFKINPSQDCKHHCVAKSKNQMILEYLSAEQPHISFV